MAEFVRAQIFGTTFEITSRCGDYPTLRVCAWLTAWRYTDLQPVGMGAFGLVWYVYPEPKKINHKLIGEFGQGSAHQPGRGDQEDHEAL
jgi:hypothetical protein